MRIRSTDRGELGRHGRLALACASSLVLVCVIAGPASAAAVAGSVGPTTSQAQSPSPLAKPLGAHPRVASQLTQLRNIAATRGRLAALEFGANRLASLVERRGVLMVDVEITAVDASAATQLVTRLGGTLNGISGSRFDAVVPVSILERLAQADVVQFVGLPSRLMPTALSEGVGLSGGDAWLSSPYTGAGIKVGIVDVSFTGYAARLGSSLPARVDTSCAQSAMDVGNTHGTIVSEIVAGFVPDAILYLAPITTSVDLSNAVACLVAAGVKVINMSGSFPYDGPGDGTGYVNSIVSYASSQGVLWVNAAGNSRQGHWSGLWSDADSDGFLNFSGLNETQAVSLAAGELLIATLRWNDAWGSSCNDYDLLLYNATATVRLDASTDVQNCTGNPREFIQYVAPTTGTYLLSIGRWSALGTQRFDLQVGRTITYFTPAGSIENPADNASPGALAVGAVRWSSPTVQEPFSSEGPTADGRVKPDLVAADGVSNSFGAPFFGTSAAAPHAAGAAALLRGAFGNSTASQIKAMLISNAVDIGAVGADQQTGSGRLTLGAPPVPGTVFEDDSPSVRYTGQWSVRANAGASGSSMRYSATTGAVATFIFTGPWVAVRFATEPDAGVATIVIDGSVVDQLDMYGFGRLQRAKRYTTSIGTHTIEVRVAGARSGLSSGNFVYLDGFAAEGAVAAVGTGTYEDSSAQVAFSGSWTTWSDGGHSGGSAKYSNQTGASIGLTYSGSALTLVYVKQFNTGIATVTIDGVVVDQLDTNAGSRAFQQQKTYITAAGTHTVSVSIPGSAYLIIDAFIVGSSP